VDFDGTITERDTLELIVKEFGDPAVRRITELELGRRLSLHQVIASQYATVHAPIADVLEWACRHVTFRAGFSQFVSFVRYHELPSVVVSSGVREIIQPLLAQAGADLPLVANSVDPRAAGWRVHFSHGDACRVCGEPCKRETIEMLRQKEPVIYIGDGYSDGCAALSADHVLARRRLAAYLDERGVPFEPFENFFQVVEALRRLSR
jgi:2-hydroxy-3-keto-5-methylthiopentenyl-1-phosphate phosphatase